MEIKDDVHKKNQRRKEERVNLTGLDIHQESILLEEMQQSYSGLIENPLQSKFAQSVDFTSERKHRNFKNAELLQLHDVSLPE